MNLVLSPFTYSPLSLLAFTKYSTLSFNSKYAYKLVTILKVIDALIQDELTVSFKFFDFIFQFYFLFVPEMSASITSYIVQTLYIVLPSIMYLLRFTNKVRI